MSEVLLAAIAKSENATWLENCRDHNRRNGNKTVAEAADNRLREINSRDALRMKPETHSVEDRVYESVRVYRALLKLKHGKNQAAGYTEREIKQHGPRAALIRTILRGKKTEGLKLLAGHGRLDCAYEQIAIDYAHEMPDEVIVKARQTLAEFISDTNVTQPLVKGP